MRTSLIRAALVAAALLPVGIAASAPAQALSVRSVRLSSQVAASHTERPFKIRAGKIYDVVSTLHGVRANDRLALESNYDRHWHKIGSWALHAGEQHFRGEARTSHPGMYTLRVQFLRGGRLLPLTASNTFRVDVLRFGVPVAHRSGGQTVTQRSGFGPHDVVSGWTTPQCGVGNDGGTIGLGTTLYVPAPVSRLSGTGEVNQVLWVRDALPGGNYGSWYVTRTDEQFIHPADPNILTITGAGDIKDSSYLDDLYVGYQPQDEYHQIAWNLQVQNSDGSWNYIANSAYTPGGYQQWNQRGDSYQPSVYCMTYRNGGQ